jgi:hypothetical protein
MNDSDAMATLAWLVLGYLTGLHWLVQVSVYPAFRQIDRGAFVDWHARHTRTFFWLAGVPMMADLALSLLLLDGSALRVSQLIGSAALWLVTFSFQVPLHRRLANGFDGAAVGLLIATDRIRTGIVTLRCLVALVLLP